MKDYELNEAVAIKLCTYRMQFFTDVNTLEKTERYMGPDYCHDIAAAWECLSRIPFPWSIRKVDGEYWIAIQNRAYDLTTIKDREIGRAICRAFLELKER